MGAGSSLVALVGLVASEVMAMTTETRTRIDTSTGEHDKFSHICWEPAGVGILTRAYCGKVWVPTVFSLDPNYPYPLCPTCDEIDRITQ